MSSLKSATKEALKAKPKPKKKTSPKKTKPSAKENAGKPSPTAKGAEGDGFIPRIVVFACNWCSYAGADTAGISHIQYSPHFRIIRVMCSGRVNPAFVLRAFELGADGVLVSGCHFGDCHYINGNERAAEQFEKTKKLIRLLGMEKGRIRLEWISAAEGVRFGQVIDEFVSQITALGPSKVADVKAREKPLPDSLEEYER